MAIPSDDVVMLNNITSRSTGIPISMQSTIVCVYDLVFVRFVFKTNLIVSVVRWMSVYELKRSL